MPLENVALLYSPASAEVEIRVTPTDDVAEASIAAALTQDGVQQAGQGVGAELTEVSPATAQQLTVAPPPPVLPSPMAPPGFFCSDDCATARNGICEDVEAGRLLVQAADSLSDKAAGECC